MYRNKRNFVTVAILAVCLLAASASANPPNYRLFKPNGVETKGWKADQNGKIKIKLWLDSLSATQKALAKTALKTWAKWATANAADANSNYANTDPPYTNKSVMNGKVLQDGTSARCLSQTDINGMNHLYKGKTFEITVVEKREDANFTTELADQPGGTGGCTFDADGHIVSGWVKLPKKLGNVGGDPPIAREWFFVTDSDGNGKITNADKDANGKLIKDYTQEQGNNVYWTHWDFYSLTLHEFGHGLGFDHSVPEPAAGLALLLATLLVRPRVARQC